MPKDKIPFYAQAAVLDSFIKSADLPKSPETVNIVIKILNKMPELRDYFFKSDPHFTWAQILWENGFLSTPPPTDSTKEYLTSWDAQNYLISVANHVPEIVLKHIESLSGHSWYKSQSIEALNNIEPEKAINAVPKVLSWLADDETATTISRQVEGFVSNLVNGNKIESAFLIYESLTSPIQPKNIKHSGSYVINSEAKSKFRGEWNENKILKKGVDLFFKHDPLRLINIYEKHLLSAVSIEGLNRKIDQFESVSWWRSAIEQSNQDSDHDYRDRLLSVLRDSIIALAEKSLDKVEPIVKRYLKNKAEILNRLGLYVVSCFPEKLNRFLIDELTRFTHLDQIGIHHEFFGLLRNGFQYLSENQQKSLLDSINNGPPVSTVKQMAQWAEEEKNEDPTKYAKSFSERWILDRLLMIKKHLDPENLEYLTGLIEQYGEPDHPEFTRWHSGAYFVRNVSPIEDKDLKKLTPDELFDFVINWSPPQGPQFGPDQISFEGLANEISKIVIKEFHKYQDQIIKLALYRSEFACSFLDFLKKNTENNGINWEASVSLSEKLIFDDTIRTNSAYESGRNWIWVRNRIAQLLQIILEKGDVACQEEFLDRIKTLLLILINDTDPSTEDDDPEKGWFGHKDPSSVAINHVRPIALSTLILYTLIKAKKSLTDQDQGPGPSRIEDDVKAALENKFDKSNDPSWAIHSVFGRRLWWLYWLDKDWTIQNIDKILPENENDEIMRYFVAAWESFVIFNRYNLILKDLLKPKYLTAIRNAKYGKQTDTHLTPNRSLANHLIWDYLISGDKLESESNPLLLSIFFNSVDPKTRGTCCWMLWRIFADHPNDVEKYWEKIKSIWEWRVQCASKSNHSIDYDGEMEWLAYLPLIAPKNESILTLWPLIEGLIPHISRHKQASGWRSLEKYIAAQVESEPQASIQCYSLMCINIDYIPLESKRDNARKIIEISIANSKARPKALDLIDILARKGIHEYRDLYERYT